ncbi:MAG: NAD-dependent epimerase/dehydratase family protein [Methylophilus sp.]
MAKILLVGCGALGTAVALNLYHAGHEVVGIRKSLKPLPCNMKTIQADVTVSDVVSVLAVTQPQIVIYCIAATAQNDENYYLHYVAGLKYVLESQLHNTRLERVFFVSSTRVYGKTTDALVDESTSAIAIDFGGCRLLEAEQLLTNLKCDYTILRLSGIYGAGRLYLLNMAKDIQRWPKENHWSNRIHEEDAARFVSYLVDRHFSNQKLASCYLVTDDMPTEQYVVLMWLAKKLKVDVESVEVPHVNGGKRLINYRMRETGFVLKYPTYVQGYRELLQF